MYSVLSLRTGPVLLGLAIAISVIVVVGSTRRFALQSFTADAHVSAFSPFTYHVDPSGSDSAPGTVSKPWRTLQYAALQATIPGTVVHVAPGTYFGPITSSRSGAAGAPITFVSDVRWGASIRSGHVDTIWRNTGNFVNIVGFEIAGPARVGIGNAGSNVLIFGNNVHDIPGDGCDDTGGAGIVNGNYTAHDDDVINNIVHDIGRDPSIQCATIHGIYHSNTRGRILNNIAYRNQGFGVHLWHHANSVLVANNLVFQNGHGGIVVGADDGFVDDGTVVANNMVIYNGVWDSEGHGIIEENQTGAHNYYSSNLVWGNKVNAIETNGSPVVRTIISDPKLTDYLPDGKGNYRPLSTSPAVHAGTAQYAPHYDFEGASRPGGAPADIGPYVGSAGPSVWPPAF